MSFFPYAVILQVTPVIAVAPLLQIYVESAFVAALLCAWIVAFFPILSNTTIGLKSADHNLRTSSRSTARPAGSGCAILAAPSALPFFLGGLKIAGGLALIGAVVAEFVIGTRARGSASPRRSRSLLPAQLRTALRGADPDLGHGRGDLRRHEPHQPPGAAEMARERAEAGGTDGLPRLPKAPSRCATSPSRLPSGPPGDLVRTSISIADGRSPTGFRRDRHEGRDGLPCFVDMHTHLDKGHIWPRSPNPTAPSWAR
jgi:hypothetical protein